MSENKPCLYKRINKRGLCFICILGELIKCKYSVLCGKCVNVKSIESRDSGFYYKQPSKDVNDCVGTSNKSGKEFNKGSNTNKKPSPQDLVLSLLFGFTIISHILSGILFLCLLVGIYNKGHWYGYGCYVFYKVGAFYIFSTLFCLFLPTWYIWRGKASDRFIIIFSILLIIFIILEYGIWTVISSGSDGIMLSIVCKSFIKLNISHLVVNVTLLSTYLLCRRFN